MTDNHKKSGGDLFIVDNADDHWKVQRYLYDPRFQRTDLIIEMIARFLARFSS